MTILPAKRNSSSTNEESEENTQANQQISLGLNIPPSRLNHSNIPISLNLSQNHSQLLLHQETSERQIWSCHEEIQHSRTSINHSVIHSPHAAFEDGPSCSKRRKYTTIPVVKDRYYRNQERKRFREQKQERDRTHRERDLDQKLEKCERNDLINAPSATSGPSTDNLLTDSATQQREEGSGYNSEDEYVEQPSAKLTEEEWRQRDLIFARSLEKRGFIIKPMVEDGACLFRAIADQVYGDQEMHSVVRTHCMDYILKNRDFYCAYITEDFNKYISRKRHDFVHGNHLEIQALSEMYHRSIEVYCYQLKPINIFHGVQKSDYEPIRLSYQRASHYNSITNPFNPSVGVGLGLPSYVIPGEVDRRQLNDAVRQSEELLIEQTMMEDKLKATDWEATNEVIEEQVARESYLQWCKENENRRKQQQAHCSSVAATSSSTVTSATCGSSNRSGTNSPRSSPRPQGSPKTSVRSPNLPNTRSSSQSDKHMSPYVLVPDNEGCGTSASKSDEAQDVKKSWETDSIFSRLPPEVFGVHDWEDAGLMARVLAASQQEYLDSLKARNQSHHSPGPSTSR